MIKNNLIPLAGFSTITFYAYAREIRVHGFLRCEVLHTSSDRKTLHNGIYCIFAAANPLFA